MHSKLKGKKMNSRKGLQNWSLMLDLLEQAALHSLK
jgi:hypothetical protein